MINNLKKQFTIAGVSGKKYTFNMYTFDDFDDLQSVFKSRGAIYIFTKRIWNGEKYEHTIIYCGETGDLSTRFNNHHAESCISRKKANCISIMAINDENQRKQIETDILEGNTFPCNTQHQ